MCFGIQVNIAGSGRVRKREYKVKLGYLRYVGVSFLYFYVDISPPHCHNVIEFVFF